MLERKSAIFIRNILLIVGLSFTFSSCGSDSKNISSSFEVSSPKSCSLRDKNQFVYDVLKDSYLWSDKVGALDISLDSNESQFLDHFLYKEDRFSHILTLETFTEEFSEGKSTNFGYLSALVANGQGGYDTKVAYVYKNSPAQIAGLHRADKILSLDEDNESSDYILHIKTPEGAVKDLRLQPKDYTVENITHKKIFSQGEKKIGYFLFQSFVGPNLNQELDATFAYFKANAVSELILDLRYNGGGLLHVAAHLGALIGGYHVKGHIFQRNRFNQKYSHFNENIYFDKIPQESLDLSRVVIIATQNSASASESLINALKARNNHIEVVTIGTPTYGKPFGMLTMPYCDRVLIPIHFADENSDGEGGFVDGLTPTCFVVEDFNRDFADVNETLLQNALFYLEKGVCKP